MKTKFFLLTPKNVIPLFVCAADRAYFSKPVEVIPQYSTTDRLLWVADPARGHTYPVNPKNIKREFQLSKRQLAEGGAL